MKLEKYKARLNCTLIIHTVIHKTKFTTKNVTMYVPVVGYMNWGCDYRWSLWLSFAASMVDTFLITKTVS